MKKITKEQVKEFFSSPEADDLKVLIAFGINKTKTEVDNTIVAEAGDYAEIIADFLETVEELEPTGKEAILSALNTAERIAEATDPKWDDMIISLIKKVI